jgi:tetratricopeptide (TPR) repeat protein
MKLRFRALVSVCLLSILGGTGCNRIRAKMAFKDGNKVYSQDKFKEAIPFYERATDLDPNLPEAWFYLGSSQQGLYRPGKESPDNLKHLDDAIQSYEKSLEVNTGDTPNAKAVKENALGALTGIYADDPKKDYEKAKRYAEQLIQENPNSSRNLFAMANLYEKFNKIDEAEQLYQKAWQAEPEGKTAKEKVEAKQKACGALASFYNKPLWDGRSKFDQAIDLLNKCADLDPNDEKGYYKVATFYWDKAFRDPLLDDKQKDTYADKGLEAVDHALRINPQYADALAYKNLLYRVKAGVTTNPKLRQEYLEQASTLQKQALELKKQQAEAAPAPTASPSH